MTTYTFRLLFLGFALLFASCSNDDDTITVTPLGDYENGILISHEGNFGLGNASVSYVSNDFMTVDNGIFEGVNSSPLGDSAQSIAFNGDLAYIIVNGSNAIEIVNRYTFESVATINTGLNNPRYMAFANGKGYVTNWGDGTVTTDDYIAIIDTTSNALEAQTISVAEGPERIMTIGNTIYVAHKGGFGQNNILSKIDAISNSVATITVGDVPNSMQLDASGNLWVLCEGNPSWSSSGETAGQLAKVNTADDSVTMINFQVTQHPSFLSLDNGALYYYLGGSVYRMETTATNLPTSSEIDGLNFYGMTTNNGILYGVDAVDFSSNGSISAYNLSTNTMSGSAELGIIPSGIYVN